MKIVRGRLDAADVSNPKLRYNSGCDCVEYTPDGGATWNLAPESDPRHSLTLQLPPRGGSDPACDAAASKVKWLKDFIDQLTADLALAGEILFVVNLLLDYVDLLAPEFGILLDVITNAASGLTALGGTLISAAFTSDQYDLLQCIFNCNSDSDGTVSAAQLATTQTDVTDQLNTTAAIVVNLILSLQGEVGLTNAGTLYAVTGDCSACSCAWYYRLNFLVQDWGFAAVSFNTVYGGVGACTGTPSYTVGVGFQNSNDGSGWFQLGVRGLIPDWILAANPEQWAADWNTHSCGGYAYGRYGAGVETTGTGTVQGSYNAYPDFYGTGVLPLTPTDVQIDLGACAGGCNNMLLTYIDFWGHGDPPIEP